MRLGIEQAAFGQHSWIYINNSLHLARKYAQIFVRGHYLFREANSFPRAKLEENCELRGADNVQGQISEHIFKAKWRLLWLLSFKYFSQHVVTSLSIGFISFSITKANRSPILTLILIVNKTRLKVFEIGEYHLGNIIGYSPVLAGVYSVT